MKKNIKYLLSILSVFTLIITSCTDEDKFTNPVTFDLAEGAYVRFVEQTPEFVVDAADITQAAFVNAAIEPVGPVSSATVEIAPVIAGVSLDTVVFKTFNSFPADVSFTSQEMATFLGLNVDDIAGGDSFEFFTTLTLADGRVISWKPNEFVEGDEDDGTVDSVTESDGTVLTDATVITDSRGGYRQALNYLVNFVCPFVNTDLEGTYTVTRHRFDAFFGAQPATREVVAGPAANQFTIIGGAVPLDGADDLIVNVDLVTGTVLGAANPDDIHFNTFGPGTYGTVSGLAISCAGVVDLTITSPGFIDNFLTMRKN